MDVYIYIYIYIFIMTVIAKMFHDVNTREEVKIVSLFLFFIIFKPVNSNILKSKDFVLNQGTNLN